MDAKELLLSMNACHEAIRFADGKTIKQVWEECHRGDWMLWFYQKQFPNDIRKLTLAKAYCANTVRHLMNDERSKKAVDVAIRFGYGFATLYELKSATYSAYAAANAAYAAAKAAYAEAYAANAAAYAAYAAYADYAASYAAYADYADYAASYAAADAAAYADYAAADGVRSQNQLLTADICRQFLDISSLYDVGE